MESAPGPETVIDGVPYLYFGGTSYLGLAGQPEVIEAGCAALRRYGVHSATSRAWFGTNPAAAEVERRAAEFFGTEDAFYFGSGYVANHVMVNALAPGLEVVLVDQSAHYCVQEAAKLASVPVVTYRSRDLEDLARQVKGRRRVLVMADAVGPTSGAVAPVAGILRVLANCPESHLLLDDAHGFGVLGEHGRGAYEECGLWSQVNGGGLPHAPQLWVCGTLSKALGGFGGIVPGTQEFVARARQASHYFDGASGPASAEAGASAKALELVLREPDLRRRLRANASRLRAALRELGLSVPDGHSAQFGVSIGTAEHMRRIHEGLKARGIMVPYIKAYSGIPAEGVLRFAVFANHTDTHLERLAAELRGLL